MAGVVVVVLGFYRNRYPFKVQLRASRICVQTSSTRHLGFVKQGVDALIVFGEHEDASPAPFAFNL